MIEIVIDEHIREQLKVLKDPVVLYVEDGRVVGVSGGEPDPADRPPDWPAPPTPEEFERMRKGPSYSTQEVLDYLRKL